MSRGDHVHITPEAVRIVCTTPDHERSEELAAMAAAITQASVVCEICSEIFEEVSEQIIAEHTGESFDKPPAGA